MTKVSIIIPVYNQQKYIKRCMDSAINQTLEDKEIIVVNDGSTDNTSSILNNYLLKNVKIINQENSGVAVARNKGLSMASGEYIQFLDSDDYLKPKALEILYNTAKKNDVDIVRMGANTRVGLLKLGENNYFGKLKKDQILNIKENKEYIVHCLPSIWDKFMNHDLLDGINFPEGVKWEDLAITPYILAKSNNLYHLNKKLYNYNFMFNTTIYDTFHKCKRFTELFKVLDILEDHFVKSGLDKDYKEQLDQIFILHVILRLNDILCWKNIKNIDRVDLVRYVVRVLNIKCPNWQNNDIIRYRKDIVFKNSVRKAKKYIDSYSNLSIQECIKNMDKVLKNEKVIK